METSSWFLTSLLLSGLVNALSAIPMSRFNSNKMFDLKVRALPTRPTRPPTHTRLGGPPMRPPSTPPACTAHRPARRPDAPAPPSHPSLLPLPGPQGQRLHLRRDGPHVHVPVHCVVVLGRLPRLPPPLRHPDLDLLGPRVRRHHRQLGGHAPAELRGQRARRQQVRKGGPRTRSRAPPARPSRVHRSTPMASAPARIHTSPSLPP